MTLAGVAKFVLGVSLAIAITLGGGVLVGLYFMYRFTTHPPKPVFPNEKVTAKVKNSPQATTAASQTGATPPKPSEAKPSETPKPSETTAAKPLPPGTYKARVNWSQGLSLRGGPNTEAERVGGLEYNQQVIILEESADKNWQKVRLADGELEGWIKAGNIERIQQ